MVGGGAEGNTGSRSGDDEGVCEYIGGSERRGQPRGRGVICGEGCGAVASGDRVPRMQGEGERDPAWVIFFVYDAITVEVQSRKDDPRCEG